MKRLFNLLIIFTFFSSSLLFTTCKKDTVSAEEELTNVSVDDALADDLFDDITNQAEVYGDASKSGFEKGACNPEITKSGLKFPRTITINFGTEGCEGRYGHIRKGKIIINETGSRIMPGSVSTFTLENYYVDDFKIEGTRTVTNLSDSTAVKIGIVLTGGKITTPEAKVITRNASSEHILISGKDTPLNIWDDKWSVTGVANGLSRAGKEYTTLISEPLVFDRSCKFKLTKGTVTINSDSHVIIVNYGTGSCDNEKEVSIDGISKTEHL